MMCIYNYIYALNGHNSYSYLRRNKNIKFLKIFPFINIIYIQYFEYLYLVFEIIVLYLWILYFKKNIR